MEMKLDFVEMVRREFAMLDKLGFSEIEALPTIVRYRKGQSVVDVYIGRKSFEIGFGVTFNGKRYSLSEIVRASDRELAEKFRYRVARDEPMLQEALVHLRTHLCSYGLGSLDNDRAYFSRLDNLGRIRGEEYALDVLAEQVRPKAAAAFRRGDYSEAAKLFGQLGSRLSNAEAKMLQLAKERSGLA